MSEGAGGVAQALVSAALAALVVVGVSLAVERAGGALGGVLGTTPTTIVAACVGFAARLEAASGVRRACYAVPGGMLLSVGFLALWRFLPPRFACVRRFEARLGALLACCVAAWLVLATVLEVTLSAALDAGSVPPRAVGLVATGLMLALGVALAWLRPLPDRKATRRVKPHRYAVRSLAAAASIFVAVLLASVSSTLAGIVSTFPSIFITTTFFVTLDQGDFDLAHSAIAPMILGAIRCEHAAAFFSSFFLSPNFSVPCFAMLFAELFPEFLASTDGNLVAALAATVPVVWLISVCCVSVPAFLFIRWVAKKKPAAHTQLEEEDDHGDMLDAVDGEE